MTAKVSNELIFEVLKRIQMGVAKIEDDATEIKSRLTNLESGFAGLRKDNRLSHNYINVVNKS